jgi:hypothetical protein
VAHINNLVIRLLSLKLILILKSILRQNNRDFIKNNKSINYNDYNNIKRINFNLVKNIYSF